MSKLISTLVGAGFALAVGGAYANDPNKNPDDQDWQQPQAPGQSQQPKGKVAPDQAAKPGRTARGNAGDATMQPGQQSQPGGSTAQPGGSTAQPGSPAQPDQTGQRDQKQIPNQSMPSVGHPAEGAATGQFGEKKFDQRTGQSGSNQPPTN